jgi:hypothetical protein
MVLIFANPKTGAVNGAEGSVGGVSGVGLGAPMRAVFGVGMGASACATAVFEGASGTDLVCRVT